MDFHFDRDLPILERTPAVLAALIGGLNDGWTHRDYGPHTWSVHEIVGHLIHGERTDWLPRARIILEQGERGVFERFDRSGHAELCRTTPLPDLLRIFADERRARLAELRGLKLTAADLSRSARHPVLGPATLGQLLSAWVVHDLNHIAQVCKAMAYQHREEVGPWERYLSILAAPAPR
ncbi:MAG: DinB family protein [Phycisphaerales bacterium]|nr:DinB family protein [Phycisphaerales bacterium]